MVKYLPFVKCSSKARILLRREENGSSARSCVLSPNERRSRDAGVPLAYAFGETVPPSASRVPPRAFLELSGGRGSRAPSGLGPPGRGGRSAAHEEGARDVGLGRRSSSSRSADRGMAFALVLRPPGCAETPVRDRPCARELSRSLRLPHRWRARPSPPVASGARDRGSLRGRGGVDRDVRGLRPRRRAGGRAERRTVGALSHAGAPRAARHPGHPDGPVLRPRGGKDPGRLAAGPAAGLRLGRSFPRARHRVQVHPHSLCPQPLPRASAASLGAGPKSAAGWTGRPLARVGRRELPGRVPSHQPVHPDRPFGPAARLRLPDAAHEQGTFWTGSRGRRGPLLPARGPVAGALGRRIPPQQHRARAGELEVERGVEEPGHLRGDLLPGNRPPEHALRTLHAPPPLAALSGAGRLAPAAAALDRGSV